MSLNQSNRYANLSLNEFANEHHEFARAFESFPSDADSLYPGWRERLGVATT